MPLGLWGIKPDQSEPAGELVTERLAVYSPDGSTIAFPDGSEGVATVERIADGQRWQIDNQERSVSFTPDSRRVLWTTYDEDAPRDSRVETIWLADLDGSNVQAVFSGRRTDPVTWLSDDELLMTRRLAGTSDRELITLSVDDGVQAELTAGPRMRGLALSPDKRLLVYYVSLEQDRDRNGVWLLDLQNPGRGARKLPFFGTYRWRDNQRLIYVPYEPTATEHTFFEYNVDTEHSRRLFPDGPNLIIANNDWQVSPDGRRLALVAANGTALDGIWVLDIAQE
jgi:Tol biopolymer transport system component